MPRKREQEPVVNIPPGPIYFEVRINGKIALLQRVHAYNIDQQLDGITVTASLRPPPDNTEPVLEVTSDAE